MNMQVTFIIYLYIYWSYLLSIQAIFARDVSLAYSSNYLPIHPILDNKGTTSCASYMKLLLKDQLSAHLRV